jgi:hypothetical protein
MDKKYRNPEDLTVFQYFFPQTQNHQNYTGVLRNPQESPGIPRNPVGPAGLCGGLTSTDNGGHLPFFSFFLLFF